MKLLEHRAKELFRSYGIPTAEGYVINDPSEIMRPNGAVVLKAQVLTGGRGKAGGIRFASDQQEAVSIASELLGMTIGDHKVESLLVERRLALERELYFSLVVDRSSRLPLILASREGGTDIELVDTGRLGRWTIHPFVGLQPYLIRDLSHFLGVEINQTKEILDAAWRMFREKECELLEINPLGLEEGHLIAADAKVIINDDALFRHPEFISEPQDVGELEKEAGKKGIALVRLDGNIGVIANGAGLTMATLDSLSLHGGKGGVFLDLGGTDDVVKVVEAFDLMVRAGPDVILLNIFGAITKCDTVAEGLVEAKRRLGIDIPIVARIRGINEERAIGILTREGINALRDLDQACETAARLGVG